MTIIRRAACAAVLCLLAARSGAAQQPIDQETPGLGASRLALEAQLRRVEQVAKTGDSSTAVRDWARRQTAAIDARLRQGDFQVGDRIALKVEGDPSLVDRPASAAAVRSVEEQLSDTFTVGPRQEITLPVLGMISLRGVLRAELEEHLTAQIGQFLKDPVLHAHPLIRMSVMGAVIRPGYYSVPANALVTDVLMAAGGYTPVAKPSRVRVERAGKSIWDAPQLRLAMTEGRTLDQLNLSAGDQFFVPGGQGTTFETLRFIAVLLSIPVTAYTLTHILKK